MRGAGRPRAVRRKPGEVRDVLPREDSFRAEGSEELNIGRGYHLPSTLSPLPAYLLPSYVSRLPGFLPLSRLTSHPVVGRPGGEVPFTFSDLICILGIFRPIAFINNYIIELTFTRNHESDLVTVETTESIFSRGRSPWRLQGPTGTGM